MSRGQVTVRQAAREDAAAVARLWAGLVVRPSGDPVGLDEDEARVASALERHAEHPDTDVLVAETEQVVCGAVYLRSAQVSPLDTDPAVHVSHLQVDPQASGGEVGTALLEAALAWAEERGVVTLLAGSAATDRESNRFLARLGLGQVGVLRATTTPALRARLARDAAGARRGVPGTRRAGQVVAARRSQRRLRAGDVPT